MSWHRIRGHDAVRQRFETALAAGRLGQAYLFVGPEGVGKRLFAGELGKALLCEGDTASLVTCDKCPSCKLVDAGTHPDVYHAEKLEDKTELTIDVIRGLLEQIGMKPTRGKRKIVTIDDVDTINDEAANAFLKSLEEPPEGSLLILLATSIESQLPTILSRCQVVRFNPLSRDDVIAVLRANGIEDATIADRATRLSGGSPGTALSLADPAIWAFRESLLSALAAPKVRATGLIESWLRFIEEAGKENIAKRRQASQTMRMLIDFLRRTIRRSVGGMSDGLTGEDAARADALVRQYGTDELIARLDEVFKANERIDRIVPLPLVVESLADRLARPPVAVGV